MGLPGQQISFFFFISSLRWKRNGAADYREQSCIISNVKKKERKIQNRLCERPLITNYPLYVTARKNHPPSPQTDSISVHKELQHCNVLVKITSCSQNTAILESFVLLTLRLRPVNNIVTSVLEFCFLLQQTVLKVKQESCLYHWNIQLGDDEQKRNWQLSDMKQQN